MDASDLLGTYLSERGYGTFERVCGERRDPDDVARRPTHAWLEGAGLIVDITADQFAEVREPVIVAEHSDWHRTWNQTSRRPADFRSAGSPEMHVLKQVYDSAAACADAVQGSVAADQAAHRSMDTFEKVPAGHDCRRAVCLAVAEALSRQRSAPDSGAGAA